jgi:hypothetical protein
LVAYCVAGRGGTAAAEKADGEEEEDSSGSPSSRSVVSGGGSIDAAGPEEEPVERLGRRREARRLEWHGELEKTNGNGERETKGNGNRDALQQIRFPSGKA